MRRVWTAGLRDHITVTLLTAAWALAACAPANTDTGAGNAGGAAPGSPRATVTADSRPTTGPVEPRETEVTAIQDVDDPTAAPTPTPAPGSRCNERSAPYISPIADWINTFRFEGVSYIIDYSVDQRAIGHSDLGPVYDRVMYRLDGGTKGTDHILEDGDATLLDEGIRVYEVKGYSPRFRLAACYDGLWRLYEVYSSENAVKGADLLDIEGKVRYIGINAFEQSETELAAIENPNDVTALVESVLTAPVDQTTKSPDPYSDPAYRVVFHLKDGTTVSRVYRPSSGAMERGIKLPRSFASAVEDALKQR